MTSLFKAFIDSRFEDVFSFAATSDKANATVAFDIETIHSDARKSVQRIVEGGKLNRDPSRRIALIQGPAGYGKTHSTISELWKLAQKGDVYPVIMQLSVNVGKDKIYQWMLRSIVDQLDSNNFADAEGHRPLKRLADSLWAFASDDRRKEYERARDYDDEHEMQAQARSAVKNIHKKLKDFGIRSEDRPLIAGILLAADDASLEFRNWLRTGEHSVRWRDLELQPLSNESDRREVIISIAKLCNITNAPLVLVFDQIESISNVGNKELLSCLVASAIQLVEHDIKGTAVIFSALGGTFERLDYDGLVNAGFKDRIQTGIKPVVLIGLKPEELKELLKARCNLLFEMTNCPQDEQDYEKIIPDWLILSAGGNMIRATFQAIADYREKCIDAGRFLSKDEYFREAELEDEKLNDTVADEKGVENVEFDKLWADAKDRNLGNHLNITKSEQVDLFCWLAKNAAEELPSIDSVYIEVSKGETQIFDLHFKGAEFQTLERWNIAFADATDSQNKLRDQIAKFHSGVRNAKPALLRTGIFRRIKSDGTPQKNTDHVRGENGKPQAGQPLADILEAGGRLAPTQKVDWERLHFARNFIEEHVNTPGFTQWRKENRFLLDRADIGIMAKLVQPEGKGM